MPRAKRSRETTDMMRRQLLDAAREAIAEQGLSGVTARGLATRLGWAVGTIYTVAPSLDAIMLEVNAEELQALSDALSERRDALADAPARETVLALAAVYLDFTRQRPLNWSAIFDRDGDGPTPDWYRARQDALFALLEAELTPLVADAAEARQAARALWAALQGILALSTGGHIDSVSEQGVDAMARYLVETFLDGLAARAG